MSQESQSIHHPWVNPPKDKKGFYIYINRFNSTLYEGFVICDRHTHHLLGVVTLNHILRGGVQTASIGYYVNIAFQRKGIMKQAIPMTLDYAFKTMKLHRIEANIQPENLHSIALIKQCGFRKEGVSQKFLKIRGAWRDHERWALLDEEFYQTHS